MRVNRLWRRRKWRKRKHMRIEVPPDCPFCGMPIPKRPGKRVRHSSCYSPACMREARSECAREKRAFIKELVEKLPSRCTRCGVRPRWTDPGGVKHKWCRVCSKREMLLQERRKERKRAEYEAHQAALRETELRIAERAERRRSDTQARPPRTEGPPLEL